MTNLSENEKKTKQTNKPGESLAHQIYCMKHNFIVTYVL